MMTTDKKTYRFQPKTLTGIAAFLMSAMVMASCSSSADAPDDPVNPDVKGYSISFHATDTASVTTRATMRTTGLSELGYNEIVVYGYKTLDGSIQNVMPGYTLKYTANSANSSTTNTTGWEYVGQGKDYLGLDQEINTGTATAKTTASSPCCRNIRIMSSMTAMPFPPLPM